MTIEEAKEIFLNRGYIQVKGGKIYDGDKWRESVVVISKWLEQEPCEDAVNRENLEECEELMTDINGDTVYAVRMSDIRKLPPIKPQPNYKALKIISETMMDMINNKPFEEVMGNLENNMREMGIEVPILKDKESCEDCISREEVCDYIAEFVNHEYATDRERELVKNIIGGIQHLPSVRPKTELETWEGVNAQITAPKGTFDKIWNEAEDNDEI